jgi:hypothetical protein
MKPNKINGVQVWKDFEDLAARLELNVIQRAVYSHLLLHTRLDGKLRLHFTLPELARKVRISRGPVRDALHRLAGHGALRFIERSYKGYLVEVRLPAEVPTPRFAKREANGQINLSAQPNLEELDFLRARKLRQAIHAREAASAFIACAGFPAGPAAWTTSCRAPSPGKIPTSTWFPAACNATGKSGIAAQKIFCASSTARGACRPRTSAHASANCRTSPPESSGHKFLGPHRRGTARCARSALKLAPGNLRPQLLGCHTVGHGLPCPLWLETRGSFFS